MTITSSSPAERASASNRTMQGSFSFTDSASGSESSWSYGFSMSVMTSAVFGIRASLLGELGLRDRVDPPGLAGSYPAQVHRERELLVRAVGHDLRRQVVEQGRLDDRHPIALEPLRLLHAVGVRGLARSLEVAVHAAQGVGGHEVAGRRVLCSRKARHDRARLAQ